MHSARASGVDVAARDNGRVGAQRAVRAELRDAGGQAQAG